MLNNINILIVKELQQFKSIISKIKISEKLNQKEIGAVLGYENESYFSQMMNGKTAIRKEIYPSILNKFRSSLSDSDILYINSMINGNSTDLEQLDNKDTTEPNLIPIYDLDFCCGDMRRETNEEHIIGGLSLPNIRKDAVIITATGDSMSPTINNGDRIILHQVNSWTYFNYGAVYGIVTEEYRLIKRVRKHPSDKNLVLLRSENAEYDDIELPIADIRQLFSVDGVFKINML